MFRLHSVSTLLCLALPALAVTGCSVTDWSGKFLSNCGETTEYTGNVILDSTADSRALRCVSTLHGNLTISPGQSAIDLGDLQHLQHIEGSLIIGDRDPRSTTPGLTSLQGLGRLESVTEDFIIRNTSLETLSELTPLKNIGRSLSITNNLRLRHLEPFASLESIGAQLNIRDNPVLPLNEPFERLTSVGSLHLSSLPLVHDLSAFASVKRITSDLTLSNLPIKDFSGLSSLESIRNRLYLSACSSLETMHGLENLRAVRHIEIQDLPQLSSLGHLRSLAEVSDKLSLDRLPKLRDLQLPSLTLIGGLSIRKCPKLEDLSTFSVKEINTVSLIQNERLAKVDLEAALGNISSILIFDLPNLESLRISARHIRTFQLAYLPRLDSLSGLEDLEAIEQLLSIRDLPKVATLGGLNSLTTLPAITKLIDLPRLTSVTQLLSAFDDGGSILSIYNLPNLTSEDLATLERLNSTHPANQLACEGVPECFVLTSTALNNAAEPHVSATNRLARSLPHGADLHTISANERSMRDAD